jgi:hypothetical protein
MTFRRPSDAKKWQTALQTPFKRRANGIQTPSDN